MKIVLATRNQGKIEEIRSLLEGEEGRGGIEISSLKDYPAVPEIAEDGSTFSENARKKALTVAQLTGQIAVADDSGIEVDALGGAPGVYSARFAGEGASDSANIKKLLDLLRDIPPEKRGARFVCVMALATPDGEVSLVDGECRGVIAMEERGTAGFGYDPVFIVPGYGETFAELGSEVKNRISHRARALSKLCRLLGSLNPRRSIPPL